MDTRCDNGQEKVQTKQNRRSICYGGGATYTSRTSKFIHRDFWDTDILIHEDPQKVGTGFTSMPGKLRFELRGYDQQIWTELPDSFWNAWRSVYT